MHSRLEFTKKSNSQNKIILIEKPTQLKSCGLEKELVEFFLKRLKKDSWVTNENCGVYTAVYLVKSAKSSREKEEIRKKGATAHQWVKSKIDSLQIEGENAIHIELFSEGLLLSSYSFLKYFTDEKKKNNSAIKVFTTNKNVQVSRLNDWSEVTCWARDLVNEPVSYLNAVQLAKDVVQKAKEVGIKAETFNKAKIESLKMGGLLAVNKGSVDPPTFTILEWKPKNAINKNPIVLVGKGIVYDTGGLSLKPTANSMDLMKSDMAGAATMAATIIGVAKQKLPVHLVALIPSTDNRPGGNAYAPGDVIKMFNGKTVEVLNTDAEGRMILADALSYADKYKPELVIDAATLTGAAVRAIGTFASVMMGNAPQKELDRMIKAGDDSFDRVVQLPFWDDYLEEMKSSIADLKNLGGTYAGMITAGKFLEQFTNAPYIHLDIAGPSFLSSNDAYRTKGGTGSGVRLLLTYFEQISKKN